MSEENKERLLYLGNDGTFREYDQRNDIVIHCDSEEDRKQLMKKLESFIGDDAKDTNVFGKWIPVKYHEITEEEMIEECYSDDVAYIFDCKMPDDGDEILVSSEECTWVDTVGIDNVYYLESGYDWIDITAWMPLPEPYKENDDERS